MEKITYFQDHMPENICFGCGVHNHEGYRSKVVGKAMSLSVTGNLKKNIRAGPTS
ncbi:MAG: hypothetical protein RLQ12_03730 [Cyclobacteriaceae bacterium]